MKVQIKIGIASENWSHAPNQIVDVDDVTGAAWCESGVAIPLEPSAPRRPVLVIEGGEHDGGLVDLNDVTLEYAMQQLGAAYELVDGEPPRIMARVETLETPVVKDPAPETATAEAAAAVTETVADPAPSPASATPARTRRR